MHQNLMAVKSVKRRALDKGSEKFLNHAPYRNRSNHRASALLAHAPASVSHFLLVFAAVELISMPFTQYAWTWDHFLHGGMDFESSLLFLVVCLGLLFVLRHHCRQDENLRVPRWRLSLHIFDPDKLAAVPGTRALLPFYRERGACSDLARYNLPLQI